MVQVRPNATGIVVALATALALCGCANVEYENKDAWFAKPFEFVSRKGGYTFSELQETKERAQPITAKDLVDGNGSCPTPQAPQQAPQQAPAAAAANQAPGLPPAADTSSVLGGGVALGMIECDVVFRAGSPSAATDAGAAPRAHSVRHRRRDLRAFLPRCRTRPRRRACGRRARWRSGASPGSPRGRSCT